MVLALLMVDREKKVIKDKEENSAAHFQRFRENIINEERDKVNKVIIHLTTLLTLDLLGLTRRLGRRLELLGRWRIRVRGL